MNHLLSMAFFYSDKLRHDTKNQKGGGGQWRRQPLSSGGTKQKYLGHAISTTRKRPFTNRERQFYGLEDNFF